MAVRSVWSRCTRARMWRGGGVMIVCCDEVRWGDKRRNNMVLVPKVTYFLLVHMGGSPIAPARVPSVAFWLLVIILFVGILLLLLLLDR